MQNLFGLNYNEADHIFFDVLLHLGTFIAVYASYRKEIKAMISGVSDLFNGGGGQTDEGYFTPEVRMVMLLLVGTVPLLFVLPFYARIKTLYSNVTYIACMLILTGALLYVSDRLKERNKNEKTATLSDAFVIGLAQMIAVLPGISRSGVTMATGVARGMKRSFAVSFSFLLSLPAIIGSFLVSIVDAAKSGITWSLVPVYLLGMVAAAVSGYFAIGFARKLLMRAQFKYFAYYCWGFGFLALILSFIF
jgi:undecaprenyl-diphosphatase